MKQFVADGSEHGYGLVRVLCARFPGLTPGAVFKALKKKDIRVNGRRVSSDHPLSAGDDVRVYLPDALFDGTAVSAGDPPVGAPAAPPPASEVREVYRGPDLLIADKPQGLAVHSGAGLQGDTLVDLLRKRYADDSLRLCHRLDLGTGGLVMLAFGPEPLAAALDAMRRGRIVKRYRCLVRGRWESGGEDPDGFATRDAWLEKPERGIRVYIHESDGAGRLPIRTRFRLLRVFHDAGPDGEAVSELEVELGTGRTHQIRAHLAWLGHPVLGDGLYGQNSYNRHFTDTAGGKVRRQQLFATSLHFGMLEKKPPAGLLVQPAV
ncbi:MAG: RluA family pseudouridine synthase [Clostridia bacterium]|nr:RluA family pseudouridine synthase [Clostridia bacterium]